MCKCKPPSLIRLLLVAWIGIGIVHALGSGSARRPAAATVTHAPLVAHAHGPSLAAVAQRLADRDAGRHVRAGDFSLRSITFHLRSLDRKCAGGAASVGRFVDRATRRLRKYGIRASRVRYLRRLDTLVDGFPPGFDCRGMVALDVENAAGT